MARRVLGSLLAPVLLAGTVAALAPGAGAVDPPQLTVRGQFQADPGAAEEGGAEISAFDPGTARLFSTNGARNRIDVVDLSDVDAPTSVGSVDLAPYGGGVQSVAVHDGLVAAAVAGESKVDAGTVVLFDAATLGHLAQVPVGALPDNVTFTPDGSKVLVANEGEPLCTAFDDDTDTATFIDPEGSISIIDVTNLPAAPVATADFSAYDGSAALLAQSGVRLNFGDHSVSQQLEPEYLAVGDDGTAWVSLQEANAIATIDIATATVTAIRGLGTKDYRDDYELDPSNEDGVDGNFAHWPVEGMLMPDAIAHLSIGGTSYLVTANEGDAREWYVDDDEDDELCFADIERVKDLDLAPGVAELNTPDLDEDENLGRLHVTTTAFSEVDGDGDYTRLATFGGRSISIIRASDGARIWDSADATSTDTERIVLAAGTWAEGRSDDKGSEPEAVATLEAFGRHFVVAGLERTSGIVLYDATDPTAPTFLDYEAPDGDESVEGLLTVAAHDSPTGTPLVIASHEVSNTVRVFSIEGPESNLRTSLSLTPDPVPAGGETTLLVEVANDGPDTAGDVTAEIVLPAGASIAATAGASGATASRAADASSCTAAGLVVTCQLGPIANGGSTTLRLPLRFGIVGRYDVGVTIASSSAGTRSGPTALSVEVTAAAPAAPTPSSPATPVVATPKLAG